MMEDIERKEWHQEVSLEDAKSIIKANIVTAARSFIAIGFYLKHIRDHEMYQEDGYGSLWELAQSEFEISKSTASRYMSMNDRFSQAGNSPIVDEKYKEFGKSQLQEMLYLNEEQLEAVSPDLSVTEIRSIRNSEDQEEIQIPGQMKINDFPGVVPGDGQEISFKGRTEVSFMGKQAEQGMVFEMPVDSIFSEREDVAVSQRGEMRSGEIMVEEAIIVIPDCSVQYSERENLEDRESHPDQEPEDMPTITQTESDQSELPILKNDDQRGAFIGAFDTWPLWIETKETGERYYRYDLPDHTSFVVKVYLSRIFDFINQNAPYEQRFRIGWGKAEFYHMQENKYFKDCETNKSTMIEYLKKLQKK